MRWVHFHASIPSIFRCRDDETTVNIYCRWARCRCALVAVHFSVHFICLIPFIFRSARSPPRHPLPLPLPHHSLPPAAARTPIKPNQLLPDRGCFAQARPYRWPLYARKAHPLRIHATHLHIAYTHCSTHTFHNFCPILVLIIYNRHNCHRTECRSTSRTTTVSKCLRLVAYRGQLCLRRRARTERHFCLCALGGSH